MAITQFSQIDPQWKSKLLGLDPTSTIGGFGCLLTSLTMVATYYGFNETPASLNDKLKAAHGFEGPMLLGYQVSAVLPGVVYRGYVMAHDHPAPLDQIDTWLAAGKPVIIEVDWSPQAGIQTHYMCCYAKQGNDYLVYDPYPFPTTNGKIILGSSKYSKLAGGSDPSKIITGIMFFDGPSGPVTPPAPPKLDTGVAASFPLFATVDDLALRSQTIVADSTLLKRYPANTQFKVLEADAAATAKIGQQNQWLAVQAPDGTQGYVAAWLVSKSKQPPALAPANPPVKRPVPAHPSIVKTTADGVKLRSRPETSDDTILKALPLGTQLTCLDAAADVKAKVGVMFSWLNVAAPDGTQGVVAAWYVSTVSLGS
jgi:peptidase C39-like protein